ncbi:MAG TPA: IMP dehydrogenase [Candidatus Methanoculleus thermohydrogenotrophicum]|jgi:IMP dehydrogenase|nr:IMP dehydrogenase [Candidatus Methanoculleus thermohydrogenotrophicum]NLM82616.1 IMP dehydrogenase [Candidatus Methanoculleus thermohydrogenotrophicum]HOB18252.1 IMP dehydrogenase [Candidatus Methanoculleus thermohydrogenotrophicum]HPZ38375.1 IMP dehydrogenase [Candidatus Methanoculleus thermohydrogenotrophicum]HQC91603.1 IMP dehydrogenase [Candidatus Methanoculleus thermohydrogenotrophicum]
MFIEKLKMETAFTFDDVLLEPAASWVEPDEADVSSRFSRNIPLNIPLVSAAMDTVTESVMAIAMAREGGIGVIHRNMPQDREVAEIRVVKQAEDLIEREVVAVGPEATVTDVELVMRQYGVGGVPVIENGKVVGIVSRRDIRGILPKRGEAKITDYMTKKLITASEDITAENALETMYANKVERLPVVDAEGCLVGIITMRDILEKRQYPRANRDADGKLRVAAAVGPFDFERAMTLVEAGTDALVVDCAHGHNMNVVNAVREIKGSVNVDVVAGNIATKQAASALIDFVDGLKVGIGPGSICTTRIVAGVGVPQVSAIANVAEVTQEVGVPVIADGGIRYSGDIAKAIAAGADCIMAGSLFAGTDEAPGRITTIKGRRYKQYRGMGSLGVMSGGESSDRYFQKKEIGRTKFVPEGVEGVTPYVGRVSDVIYQLVGGLKSAMGYTGSKTIADLQKNGRFLRITPAGYGESHPHNIMITDEAPNYRLLE